MEHRVPFVRLEHQYTITEHETTDLLWANTELLTARREWKIVYHVACQPSGRRISQSRLTKRILSVKPSVCLRDLSHSFANRQRRVLEFRDTCETGERR